MSKHASSCDGIVVSISNIKDSLPVNNSVVRLSRLEVGKNKGCGVFI
jgi:hypothetical protein